MLKNKRKFLKWSANNARMNKIILRKLLIMDVIFDGIGTEIISILLSAIIGGAVRV